MSDPPSEPPIYAEIVEISEEVEEEEVMSGQFMNGLGPGPTSMFWRSGQFMALDEEDSSIGTVSHVRLPLHKRNLLYCI